MISASDVLQIISEIHQYSAVLLELKDAMSLGILHSTGDRMTCFKFNGKLSHVERGKLVDAIYSGQIPETVKPLPLEDFLREIEGRKAKHIWLETRDTKQREHGFMSIAELKAFFRSRLAR